MFRRTKSGCRTSSSTTGARFFRDISKQPIKKLIQHHLTDFHIVANITQTHGQVVANQLSFR